MNNNSSKGGVSIVGVVQIVFIVLKLCNLINWSGFGYFHQYYLV